MSLIAPIAWVGGAGISLYNGNRKLPLIVLALGVGLLLAPIGLDGACILLEGAPPRGQFQNGFSGLVDLPGLRVKLAPLEIQKGHGSFRERFRRLGTAAVGTEPLNPDQPPVGLLLSEALLDEALAEAFWEVGREG